MPLPLADQVILAINAGSTNIKFALFHSGQGQAGAPLVKGCVDDAHPEYSFARRFGIPERYNAAEVLTD